MGGPKASLARSRGAWEAVVPFFAVAASLARSRDLGRFRVCLWPGFLSCQLDKLAWAAALSKAEFSRASERALPFLFDQVTRDQLVPFPALGSKKSKVVTDQLVPFWTFGSEIFLNLTKLSETS